MKRLSLVMMFITITALLASTARAEVLTTNDFLEMPPDMRLAYATGVIEGVGYQCHRAGKTLEVNYQEFLEMERGTLVAVIVETMYRMKKDLPITGRVKAVSAVRAIIYTSESILACEAKPGVPS